MPILVLSLFRFVLLLLSGHVAVAMENAALRVQLVAFQRKRKRPTLTSFDRLFWVGLSLLWAGWRAPLVYVRADTVVRWQRERFRRFWARRSRVNQRHRGRPATAVEIRRLIEKGGEPEDFAIFRCRWLVRARSLHFAAATAGSRDLETEIHELNAQPALVFTMRARGSQLCCWPSQTIASTACSSMPISTPASLGTEKPAPLSVTIRDAVRSSIQRATR